LTPDGSSVVYNLLTPGIWKVSVEGGTPEKISDAVTFSEQVSPDGKFLAYRIWDEKSKKLQIVILKLDDRSVLKTIDWAASSNEECWRWTPDSSALIYINTQGGVSNLWRMPVDGTRPTQITDFKSEVIRYFSYSRDQRQLAFVRGTVTRDAVLISDEK